MILRTPTGKNYVVHFHYPAFAPEVNWLAEPSSMQAGREVQCTIHEAVSPERFCATDDRPCGTHGASVGVAVLSHKDRFVRRTGRKVALARAMRVWPRELRQEVWSAYFNKIGRK